MVAGRSAAPLPQRIAGRLCLDFVNTIGQRGLPTANEHLPLYARLVEWAADAGALLRPEARRLARHALHRPGAAREAHAAALELREALARVFLARSQAAAPAASDVATLDRWIHRAWATLRLRGAERGPVLQWPSARGDLDLPAKRVALSALELLLSSEPARVKRCASRDGCGWIFLDESKNASRRWCSMDACGAAAKLRRYRARQREARRAAGAKRRRPTAVPGSPRAAGT
jgi:predicted RNA-binding Zn ribbon-like protein